LCLFAYLQYFTICIYNIYIIIFYYRLIEKEKEDLSKKKKQDMDMVHGITRNFQVDEYVSQVRIDLHSSRAQEKRAKIAEMMRLYVAILYIIIILFCYMYHICTIYIGINY
jgi:hypothetical protein